MIYGSANRPHVRLRAQGFTLIEVLVVITIIGVLVALLTTAAVSAVKHSRQAEIKSEIAQIDAAFEQLKNKYGEYPPNCQAYAVDPNLTLKNLKRYLRKVAPRNREPDDLLANLLAVWVVDQINYPRPLGYGISPSEAIVFWLGGFSSDPNYPISGDGGPAYSIPKRGDPLNRTLDPIENRIHKGFYPFDITRLGPRDADGYFDDYDGMSVDAITNTRFIEFCINGKWRRINFWRYKARKIDEPYIYFDVSRASPSIDTDPPSTPYPLLTAMYPLKRVQGRDANGVPLTFKFANEGKFQILHCGIDGIWGDVETITTGKDGQPEHLNFLRLDINGDKQITPEERKAVIVFPEGPWVAGLGDTQVNFTTEMTVEDAKP
jgi:prepilin-type N-terminal cleavage/methylation domain-containing protein